MPIIKIEIKNCKECPHFNTTNTWSSDGWDGIEWKIGCVQKQIKKYKEALNGMKKTKFKYLIGVLVKLKLFNHL